MWLKKAPYFLSHLQKALCWEQSSLPNPSCCDLWATLQKSLTSLLFSREPSGAAAPWGGLSVAHILRDYIARGQPKSGNTKTHGCGTTAHTPWGHNLLSFSGCEYFNFRRARSCCFHLHTIKYFFPESKGNQIPDYFDGFNLSEHWSKRKILWGP